jgi:hypothetical protein
MMSREKDDSARKKRAPSGARDHASTCETKPGTKTRSIGPSPIT